MKEHFEIINPNYHKLSKEDKIRIDKIIEEMIKESDDNDYTENKTSQKPI